MDLNFLLKFNSLGLVADKVLLYLLFDFDCHLVKLTCHLDDLPLNAKVRIVANVKIFLWLPVLLRAKHLRQALGGANS